MMGVELAPAALGAPARRWKPYSAYKDSGVEWLGKVPEGWKSKRLKYISTVNDETLSESTDSDFELLYVDISSVDSVSGIKSKEYMTFENAPSRARRKVRHGDIIISTVRTYLRAISPINNPEPNMIVSTGFAVIHPKKGIESQFAAYVLRAPYFVDEVVANSVGVSYPAINASELITFYIILPPLPEQRAISAFLDRKTARIDTLISKKERLISLLKEKRAALISHTVTKGLDPDVPMKDSGVEWLGEIPVHWKIGKLRWYLSLKSGDSISNTEFSIESDNIRKIPVIGGNGLTGFSEKFNIHIPTIAIGRVGALCGNVHLINDLAWITDNALLLTRWCRFDREFLGLLIRVMNLNVKANQNAQPLITGELVKNQKGVLPPLDEQKMIVEFLKLETIKLDTLISKIQEAIEKLQEYRTALISAAVTGKIDVSNEKHN